jgi:hypothetical protein
MWIPSTFDIAIVMGTLVCENAELVLAGGDTEVEVFLEFSSEEVGVVSTMLTRSEISVKVRTAHWGFI